MLVTDSLSALDWVLTGVAVGQIICRVTLRTVELSSGKEKFSWHLFCSFCLQKLFLASCCLSSYIKMNRKQNNTFQY